MYYDLLLVLWLIVCALIYCLCYDLLLVLTYCWYYDLLLVLWHIVCAMTYCWYYDLLLVLWHIVGTDLLFVLWLIVGTMTYCWYYDLLFDNFMTFVHLNYFQLMVTVSALTYSLLWCSFISLEKVFCGHLKELLYHQKTTLEEIETSCKCQIRGNCKCWGNISRESHGSYGYSLYRKNNP